MLEKKYSTFQALQSAVGWLYSTCTVTCSVVSQFPGDCFWFSCVDEIMEHLLSLCALLAGAVEVAWTFNLDTTTATRFSGPAGSQFGVSVSFHSIGNEKM